MRASAGHLAGAVDGAISLQVEAELGEVPGAEALLLGIDEVGHQGLRVEGARHGLLDVDVRDLGEEPEEVRGIDHLRDAATGLGDEGAGDEQGRPHPGLVGGALGAAAIERRQRRVAEGAVVIDEHDHRVARLRPVVEGAIGAALGEAGADQQAPDFRVHGLDHLLAQGQVLLGIVAVDAIQGDRIRRQQRAGRRLQRRMYGREADGRHPGPVLGSGVDPGNGLIDR